MSKADLRAIVDLRIDFVVQNVSTKTMQCHFTDGWGTPMQTGLQDCLTDRYQVCSEFSAEPTPNQGWFDFTACVFRNQAETSIITDHESALDATMSYCAKVTGQDYSKLKACAEGEQGAELLSASHANEVKLNPFVDKTGHHHPDWIIINGKDYGKDTAADWVQLVCDAYTGSPKPASCKPSTAVVV